MEETEAGIWNGNIMKLLKNCINIKRKSRKLLIFLCFYVMIYIINQNLVIRYYKLKYKIDNYRRCK